MGRDLEVGAYCFATGLDATSVVFNLSGVWPSPVPHTQCTVPLTTLRRTFNAVCTYLLREEVLAVRTSSCSDDRHRPRWPWHRLWSAAVSTCLWNLVGHTEGEGIVCRANAVFVVGILAVLVLYFIAGCP